MVCDRWLCTAGFVVGMYMYHATRPEIQILRSDTRNVRMWLITYALSRSVLEMDEMKNATEFHRAYGRADAHTGQGYAAAHIHSTICQQRASL
jgi:hypothetical protein